MNLYDIYGTSGDLRFKISAICRSHLGSQAFRSLALQEVRLRSRVADLKNLIPEAQIALLAAVEEPQTSDRFRECCQSCPSSISQFPVCSNLEICLHMCIQYIIYDTYIIYSSYLSSCGRETERRYLHG